MENAPVHSLNKFIQQSRSNWAQFVGNINQNVSKNVSYCVVIGNEASDLDSIVSSLSCALFAQLAKQDERKYIPIMAIPREDFSLRTDAVWIFKRLGINDKDLIFFDEAEPHLQQHIQKSEFDTSEKLNIILTDHNIMSRSLQPFSGLVTEIIDHHVDSNFQYPNLSSDKRSIELVGSASTLVAHAFINNTTIKQIISEDWGIAVVLLGTILLDTVNLDPAAKRATQKDVETVALLSSFIEKHVSDIKDFQNQLFQSLQSARFDQSQMSTNDILRCDYKQFTMGDGEIGISAVKRKINDWLDKDKNLLKELHQFSQTRHLRHLFVMTSYLNKEEQVIRELIVFTVQPHIDELEKAVEFLVNGTDLGLKEIPVDINQLESLDSTPYYVKFFLQQNAVASRKQLQPFLADYFDKRSK